MRTPTPLLFLLLFSMSIVLLSHKPEEAASREMIDIKYQEGANPWEQPNPIFRWPLPEVVGDAVINVQFVTISRDKSSNSANRNLLVAKEYLQAVFNPHGISFNFRDEQTLNVSSDKELESGWKTILPSKANQLTLYIIEDGEGKLLLDYYSTIEVVSNKSVLAYNNNDEFRVYAAKSLAHMLGLLPTYFENLALGVPAEDANNCGHAGDFVCDTPFDYLGLKQDVKKRNCKYKGDFGNPDTKNIMSNSYTICMDQITKEQGNKIKYNLSEIPLLQSTLNRASSIKLNVGMANQPTINQLTLK